MDINIELAEIKKASGSLFDAAMNAERLGDRLARVSSNITGKCYQQGGVGQRPHDALMQMRWQVVELKRRAEALAQAVQIYNEAENKLGNNSQSVLSTVGSNNSVNWNNQAGAIFYGQSYSIASNVQNGYNGSWAYNPAMQCVLGTTAAVTGAVAGESALKKYIGNHLKVSGSDKSCYTSVGTINNMYYNGSVQNYAEWDVKKGNVGVGVKGTLSASLLQIENEGRIGNAKGGYEVKVGTIQAEGKATLNIISSGEFNPKLEAGIKGEAHIIDAKIEGSYGSDDFNVHIKGEGTVGKAKTEAKIAISKDGIGGKADIGVAALSGKATAGFKIFGIKIDASIKGEVGAVGVGAEFGVSDSSFEIGGKLSFLAGLGLKIKVSW